MLDGRYRAYIIYFYTSNRQFLARHETQWSDCL
jgi:hypothetical protein